MLKWALHFFWEYFIVSLSNHIGLSILNSFWKWRSRGTPWIFSLNLNNSGFCVLFPFLTPKLGLYSTDFAYRQLCIVDVIKHFLYIKLRPGIFTVDVDNTQQSINFRACHFRNHLLSSCPWPYFRHCNEIKGKNCLHYGIYTLMWVNQNANNIIVRHMFRGRHKTSRIKF